MTKISQLADIGANLAANDEFVIRDVSDGSTPNKKVTSSGFLDYVISQGAGSGFSQIAAGVGPLARVQTTSSGATGTITFSTAAATTLIERARIDSSGRLLVGTSSASILRFGSNTAKIETNSADYHLAMRTDNNAGSAGLLTFIKTRSSAIVQNNDELGTFQWKGHDGTDVESVGASIGAFVDGTPGSNDMPGRLLFSTTADGAAGPTERMRITSTGQVRLAGAGITFNGDTAAANELDDYEEGTWTPVFAGSTTAGTPVYGTNGQAGKYTKIGNVVHVLAYIDVTGVGGAAGNININSLPFSADCTFFGTGIGTGHADGSLGNSVRLSNGSTVATLRNNNVAVAVNTGQIYLSFAYRAA
jgi:hypothetical protein